MNNIWLNGIMGVVVGDALGVPAEFCSREELKASPLTKMEGYGSYDVPEGTWSDDSSMTLATLDSLKNGYNPTDIMEKFADWLVDGKYTPNGEAFDIGRTCLKAIMSYLKEQDITKCGGTGEHDNGNGSLMRILPICLYMYEKQKAEDLTDADVIEKVHEVSALTHAHMRSKIACGLYFFMVRSILDNQGTLQRVLQKGLDEGIVYYANEKESATELIYYARLCDLNEFIKLQEEEIESTGYVVATLEAAVWSLLQTETYTGAMLTAVNLGEDTDTVAAIAGGLAGLYYGYDGIPEEWLRVLKRREWIEWMCGEIEMKNRR